MKSRAQNHQSRVLSTSYLASLLDAGHIATSNSQALHHEAHLSIPKP